MKKQINEIKRMQQLAGILNENEIGSKPKSITVKVLPNFIEYIKSIKDEESRNTGFVTNSEFKLSPNTEVKIASGPFELRMFRQIFFWAQYQPENNEITISNSFCFGNDAITRHDDLTWSPVGAPQLDFGGNEATKNGCMFRPDTYCKFENGFEVGQKDHRGYFEIIAVN